MCEARVGSKFLEWKRLRAEVLYFCNSYRTARARVSEMKCITESTKKMPRASVDDTLCAYTRISVEKKKEAEIATELGLSEGVKRGCKILDWQRFRMEEVMCWYRETRRVECLGVVVYHRIHEEKAEGIS